MRENVVEELNQNLERIIGFIGNCDNKASILLGFNGILMGILLSCDFIEICSNSSFDSCLLTIFLKATMCITIFMWSYGLYRLLKVLLPKTDCSDFADGALELKSIIYFSGISSKSYTYYKNKVLSMDDNQYLNDIASQVYLNAKICTEKFKNLRLGLIFSSIGIAMLAILFFVLTIFKI